MLFFFFNETATTEIYAYRHTRSLHYALPVYRVKRIRMIRVAGQEPRAYTKRLQTICGKRGTRDSGLGTRADCNGNQRGRSDAHTSALPPLMRISYAVFSMKTIKRHHSTTHATH